MWGFDIDGCIVNIMPTLLGNIKKMYGYDLEIEDIISHSIEDCTSLSKKEVVACIDKTLSAVDDLFPYLGAIKFLEYYHLQSGNPLMFITARWDKESTIEWLSKWLPDTPFNVVFIKGIYKIRPITKNNIKVFVEDRIEIAINLAKHGIRVLLLDREWNKLNIVNVDNIIRMKDWYEVKDYFDKGVV